MQKIIYRSSSFQVHQKLFVELVLELCDYRSLDSYRAKTAGPLFLLNELSQLIDDWKKNKIKAFETVESCKKELIKVIEEDSVVVYGRSSKTSFIKLLNGLNLSKDTNKKDGSKSLDNLLPVLEYNLYYLITINKDYIDKLIVELEILLHYDARTNYNNDDEFFEKIKKHTGYLVSELTNIGFSKSYISNIARTLFTDNAQDFNISWASFKRKISRKEKKQFIIIFKLLAPGGKLKKLHIEDLKSDISSLPAGLQDALEQIEGVKNYLNSGPNSRFVIEKVEALDYYQALKNGKTGLATLLDLMHLGHYDIRLEIKNTAIVIDVNKPEKAELQNIHYQIDGQYRSHNEVYKALSEKIKVIREKEYIAKEVLDKIEAAIRFLRTGSEAIELEQKYLSYWIGLENIFSNYNVDTSTFLRIKRFFPTTHAVSYTKRNVYYLHKTIKRLDITKQVPNYNSNLEYLQLQSTFTTLIAMERQFPLLALRAKYFNDTYFLHNRCEDILSKHKSNVEQHITRMYRIRNELVHNAATFQNIESITSSIKYYLIFMLNKIIEFFYECKPKKITGKPIDMDDFFLYQEVIWQSIEANNYDYKYLLSVPHQVDNLV